jgi:hypothetical protein
MAQNRNGWVAALAAKTGKPYRWAQYLGLNVWALSRVLSLSPRSNVISCSLQCTALSPAVHRRHVTRTMQLIEQRAIARDALAKQLLALKGVVPMLFCKLAVNQFLISVVLIATR